MKVAIMMPGLCRTFRKTAPSLRKHLLDVNRNCQFDIFIETWDIEGNFDADPVASKIAGHGDISKDWLDRKSQSNSLEIFKTYDPVYFNTEPYEPWRKRIIERARALSASFGGTHDGRFVNSVLAQYYKIKKVFLAIEEHMKYAGDYDLIVKNRFDNLLTTNVIINESLVKECADTYVHGAIHSFTSTDFMAHQKRGFPVLDDQFGFFGPAPCRTFCGLYDEIENIVADIADRQRFKPYSEFFSALNLTRCGFKLKRVPVMHRLVRT